MKIKAVIVEGELPKNCWNCSKHVYFNDSGLYCRLMNLYVKNGLVRPDWCPLTNGDKLLFEHGAMKRWIESEDE